MIDINKLQAMFLFVFLTLYSSSSLAKIITRSRSSSLQLDSNSSFVAEKAISNFSGKIIKKLGSNLLGEAISLNEGKFEEEGNKANITGNIDSTLSRIILDGSKTFQGKRGSLLRSLFIQGLSNRLEGIIELNDDIKFKDHLSSLTVAVNSKMSRNIQLNGGTLFLDDDLTFVDNASVTGSGKIIFNKRQLVFGATQLNFEHALNLQDAEDIVLNSNIHLKSTWSFKGESILNGNGNILFFDTGGKIVLQPGASLLLKNLTLQNVEGTNIHGMSNHSTFTLQDVFWIQSGDYTFTEGHFDVTGVFKLAGKNKFIYQSGERSCIHEYAQMVFEQGMTFSYDPRVIASQELIGFTGESAELLFDSASLFSTVTGMKLTKGKVRFKGSCCMACDTKIDFDTNEIITDKGIILGNDLAEDDCISEITGAATLHLTSGSLEYRNVLSDSWIQQKKQSVLRIGTDARLKLYQSLDVQNGIVCFENLSYLDRAVGSQLLGSVDINGIVGYDTLS